MTEGVSRIDAHHHVWDLSVRPQPWITGADMEVIRRSFDVEELALTVARHGVRGTIAVQTVGEVAETEELLRLADAHPLVLGVVGWVDIAAANVDDELERLLAGPGGPRLVGIRSLVQYESDRDWLDRDDVRRGAAAVARHGLAHDLLVQPDQLGSVARLAAAVPQGRFVLDHLGKPAVGPPGTAMDRRWAEGVVRVGACGNVVAKLSGLVTEADWRRWSISDIRPYVARAVEVFGPGRLLFGSDWPVCTLATSYARWVATVDELLVDLPPEDRNRILASNAATTYSPGGRPRGHPSP